VHLASALRISPPSPYAAAGRLVLSPVVPPTPSVLLGITTYVVSQAPPLCTPVCHRWQWLSDTDNGHTSIIPVTVMCGMQMHPLADANPWNFQNPRTDGDNIPQVFLSRIYSRELLTDIRKIFGCCHKILQGLHLSCYSWLAFYHTRLYYEYRVAFRCDLTADSTMHKLLGSVDVDLWSISVD